MTLTVFEYLILHVIGIDFYDLISSLIFLVLEPV